MSTERTAAEERAANVKLLRQMAAEAGPPVKGWKGWLIYGYTNALRRAADRIERGEA